MVNIQQQKFYALKSLTIDQAGLGQDANTGVCHVYSVQWTPMCTVSDTCQLRMNLALVQS